MNIEERRCKIAQIPCESLVDLFNGDFQCKDKIPADAEVLRVWVDYESSVIYFTVKHQSFSPVTGEFHVSRNPLADKILNYIKEIEANLIADDDWTKMLEVRQKLLKIISEE